MPSERGPSSGVAPPRPLPDELRSHATEFRSLLAEASEELRDWALHHEAAVADPSGVLAAELGDFGRGRVDPVRLAGIVAVEGAPDPVMHHLVALARDRFDAFLARGEEVFVRRVPDGGDLRDVVRDALADLGSAFGLGRALGRARAHIFDPDEDHRLLRPWPFHQWSESERAGAPPLTVDVWGVDLRAAGLAEFLQSSVRIVLRVQGPAPAAALSRLVSPQVFVAQVTVDAANALRRLADHEGPGVVAIFEEGSGALDFVHDPATSNAPGLALDVDADAFAATLERVAGGRPGSELADLRHLESLRGSGVTPDVPVDAPADDAGEAPVEARRETPGQAPAETPGTAATDIDRLAGFLLASLPPDADTD